MITRIVRFFALLLLILSLSFAFHLLVLLKQELPLFDHLLLRAYIVNYVLACLIFVILEIFKKKHLSSLGFIFMGGSLFKFALFFLLFYPTYLEDGNTEKAEFLTFFAPYAVSLTFETFYLVRLLNESEKIDMK